MNQLAFTFPLFLTFLLLAFLFQEIDVVSAEDSDKSCVRRVPLFSLTPESQFSFSAGAIRYPTFYNVSVENTDTFACNISLFALSIQQPPLGSIASFIPQALIVPPGQVRRLAFGVYPLATPSGMYILNVTATNLQSGLSTSTRVFYIML